MKAGGTREGGVVQKGEGGRRLRSFDYRPLKNAYMVWFAKHGQPWFVPP
jgi:hypothetical protein